MPKCNFIKITLRYECSPVNLLHIFKTPFLKSSSGGLLLVQQHFIQTNLRIMFTTINDLNNLDKLTGENIIERLPKRPLLCLRQIKYFCELKRQRKRRLQTDKMLLLVHTGAMV